MQDDQKPILRVQAEASSRSASSSTGINPQTHLHQLSFWQRLGQSINLVGIGLFLRVLFVRLSPIPMRAMQLSALISSRKFHA